MDEKLAAQAAKDAANKKANASRAVTTGDADSGRPVLKRAPGSGSTIRRKRQPAGAVEHAE